MSSISSEETSAAIAAIGRTETRSQLLDTESLRRFSLAIGMNGKVENKLPVLAHWAWFLPAPGDAEIGADGHPARGGFLPSLASLPRRMFASTAMTFANPLLLDVFAEMTSRIVDVRHKSGRTGDLVFVDVERRIEQCDALRLSEKQTLVYREAGDAAPSPLPEPEAGADKPPAGGLAWTPGTVNLFRFSAVTFNGHRIHYDLSYATGVEGYPSLIVHGPFIAAKLAELAAQNGALSTFEFRAQAPCFVDQTIRLEPMQDGEFQAIRCDGAVATTAKVSYQ
jgi:3-methylfumaryl-CoA hydratase